MKYRVNNSFCVVPLDSSENMVVCDDSLRRFECDLGILKSVLAIINKTGRLDEVYKHYATEFDRQTISDFLNTLIDENVILPVNEGKKKKVKLGVLGESRYFELLCGVCSNVFECSFFESLEQYKGVIQCYDGTLLLPGAMSYRELLGVNKELHCFGKPYVLCRFTGEKMVVGPLVFPWQTPCIECHIEQHLMVLNMANVDSVSQGDISSMLCSKAHHGYFNKHELEYIFGIALQDMGKILDEKANFQLVKKELHIEPGEMGKVTAKSFVSTTNCTCCHGKNRRYKKLNCATELSVPEMKDDMDQAAIKYFAGGLRSISSEDTEAMAHRALQKLDLDIQIKLGTENLASKIIPVYHSLLETSHKNKTPYFFEAQHSYGKGINKKQAYFSAAFELFERLSARYYGEKEIICGSYSMLKDHCADISSLAGVHEGVDTVYDRFDISRDVDWIWAYSLVDNRPKLLPASIAFLSSDMFKGNFVPNGSSGMSAGATRKDAILQGLFELIEHDAWMIGQANAVRLPIISYDGLQNQQLREDIQKLKEAGFDIISRDYTNDVGIPVIRTWISSPKSYVHYATNGFGASIYPEIALERSITEAVQSGKSSTPDEVVDYSRPLMSNLINARDGLFSLFYFQQKDILPIGYKRDISDLRRTDVSSVDEALEYVISRIKAVNPEADVLYVDFTRDYIGVPAVKVFVTKGLQPLREPLISTCDRLFSFQKKMGYAEREPRYEDLYMGPYPH